MPNQFLGVLVHTIACSGLSCVRTELLCSTETDWTIPGLSSCNPPACSLLVPISSTSQSTTLSQDVQSFN